MAGVKRDYAQGEQAVLSKETAGEWTPLVDWGMVFPGNRGVSRRRRYDAFDVPVGVKLRVEEASKSEPLLVAEDDWQGNGCMSPLKAWKESDRYHLVYYAHPAHPLGEDKSANFGAMYDKGLGGMGYAVSDDGYHWTKPVLGQVEFGGSRENNKILDGPTGSPFEDPLGTPEERFKAIGQEGGSYDPETGEKLSAEEAYRRFRAIEHGGLSYEGPRMTSRHWITGWTSPDCIHWKRIEKPLAEMPSDSGNSANYDPERKLYFAYIRIGAKGRRAIGLTETADFWHWPPAREVLSPDSLDDPDVSFYGGYYFRYPGASLHGMFVWIYHQITDHLDTQIAFSRDGICWDRPERRPVIPVGPPGSGDSCSTMPWGGLIDLPDGWWAIPYRGISWLHNSSGFMPQNGGQIIWARWKPHRFCGIEAEAEGRFTLATVCRTRGELRLNYRCKPGGWISAELIREVPSRLHPDADALEGFSFDDCDRLMGDSLSAPLTWRGSSNISGLGDSVAIRLRLFQAKVFAFSV